jgi:hypothetical protein
MNTIVHHAQTQTFVHLDRLVHLAHMAHLAHKAHLDHKASLEILEQLVLKV